MIRDSVGDMHERVNELQAELQMTNARPPLSLLPDGDDDDSSNDDGCTLSNCNLM